MKKLCIFEGTPTYDDTGKIYWQVDKYTFEKIFGGKAVEEELKLIKYFKKQKEVYKPKWRIYPEDIFKLDYKQKIEILVELVDTPNTNDD